ncbi:MAG: hypothetical protein ABIN74_11925 [Ferruginibacter sp.]
MGKIVAERPKTGIATVDIKKENFRYKKLLLAIFVFMLQTDGLKLLMKIKSYKQ